jgi:hypothetical protein
MNTIKALEESTTTEVIELTSLEFVLGDNGEENKKLISQLKNLQLNSKKFNFIVAEQKRDLIPQLNVCNKTVRHIRGSFLIELFYCIEIAKIKEGRAAIEFVANTSEIDIWFKS